MTATAEKTPSIREQVEAKVAEELAHRRDAVESLDDRIEAEGKRYLKAFNKWCKSGKEDDYIASERAQNACLGMRANQRRIKEELARLSSQTEIDRRVAERERLLGLREQKSTTQAQAEINSDLEEHALSDKAPFKVRACVSCGRPCKINTFAPPPKCLDCGGVYRGGK